MADDCLFCNIAVGAIPAKKVYEDSHTLGFLDINPRNPGHTLVIPKVHATTIEDISETDIAHVAKAVKRVAMNLRQSLKADGISIAQNNGPAAGQVVHHVHFHVIPRFANEGPVGVEGILPTKRMDDQTLDSIADKIKKGGFESGDVEPEESVSDKAAAQIIEETTPKTEKKEPTKAVTEQDFEEIDFDDD